MSPVGRSCPVVAQEGKRSPEDTALHRKGRRCDRMGAGVLSQEELREDKVCED
jgi:hypothetical protein